MEEEREKQIREEVKRKAKECSPISEMKPLNREAYGGGLYGNEKHYSSGNGDGEAAKEKLHVARASDTQSADGPVEPSMPLKHKPPPSTVDRDLDITGQTYIQ